MKEKYFLFFLRETQGNRYVIENLLDLLVIQQETHTHTHTHTHMHK